MTVFQIPQTLNPCIQNKQVDDFPVYGNCVELYPTKQPTKSTFALQVLPLPKKDRLALIDIPDLLLKTFQRYMFTFTLQPIRLVRQEIKKKCPVLLPALIELAHTGQSKSQSNALLNWKVMIGTTSKLNNLTIIPICKYLLVVDVFPIMTSNNLSFQHPEHKVLEKQITQSHQQSPEVCAKQTTFASFNGISCCRASKPYHIKYCSVNFLASQR